MNQCQMPLYQLVLAPVLLVNCTFVPLMAYPGYKCCNDIDLIIRMFNTSLSIKYHGYIFGVDVLGQLICFNTWTWRNVVKCLVRNPSILSAIILYAYFEPEYQFAKYSKRIKVVMW